MSGIENPAENPSPEGMLSPVQENESIFHLLFERSSDPIWLFDPQKGVFVDCNEAVVNLMRCKSKEQLLRCTPTELSPPRQPNGEPSEKMAAAIADLVEAKGGHRFEWVVRRMDGEDAQLEVVSTAICLGGRSFHVVVSRDMTERKQAEARIQQLNQTLEMRVRERTAELLQANEQLKAEIQERRRKEKIQRALYQISEAIHTAEDLNSLYKQVHSIIQELMDARNFYLALYDPATDLIHFPYFVDDFDPKPEPFKLNTGLTSYVLRTGKPLLVNSQTVIGKPGEGMAVLADASGDFLYRETGTPAAVWLGAPLNAAGRTFGVMALQNYQDDQAYGPEEQQILTFVAEQTALAIERKRAEQALRESEEKHRALFTASSQGVMLHDEEKFLEVNPATVRILGFNSADEIIGRHPADFAPPFQPNGERSEDVARRHIQECLEKGTARFDWVCCNLKGQHIPIEVILTRIQWGGRQIIQAVINEISERKKAEAELLRALAREKELSQLKSNFVSMVSHEFRTPLGIIMSSADILADYFDQLTPEERERHLRSIHNNTRRLADVMEEVLLIGRFDSGKMEFKPVPLNFQAFCRRLVDEVMAVTSNRCAITLKAANLPAEARADDRLLSYIFTNLLLNAVKYSPPGGKVLFEIEQDGLDAVCRIRDRGIGIPEADLQWLFKAFHRGRNVGDRPGTGLGLVIVKRCVELHNGQLFIESKVDKGTLVTVRIPVF